MAQTKKLSPEEHRRAVFYARMVYVVIFASFISVCAIAVTTTMAMEKNNHGFRPITVKQPISFIDKTYLHEEPQAKK
jgi:hypothetical protein